MSSYDLLIGLNQARLNDILAQVFASPLLRQSLFQGAQAGNNSGIEFQVSWTVDAAPSITLRNPTDEEWKSAIKAGGAPAQPVSGAFLAELSSLTVHLTAAGQTLNTTVPVRAICTVASQGSTIAIAAQGVIVNLGQSSPTDRFIITNVLVPNVLSMITQALSGISVPNIQIAGISLTPPVVSIGNGYLLTAFNLNQNGTPSIGQVALPSDPFFALLSRPLMQVAVDHEVRSNLQGKQFDQGGSEGGGGFSAQYNVHGSINSIAVSATDNPVQLRASVSLGMSASAGINTPIGVVVQTIEDVGKKIIDPDTWNPTKW